MKDPKAGVKLVNELRFREATTCEEYAAKIHESSYEFEKIYSKSFLLSALVDSHLDVQLTICNFKG